jgi:transporter family-2 protein
MIGNTYAGADLMSNSLSLSTAGLALMALIAGALVPFQAGSNATLGRAL